MKHLTALISFLFLLTLPVMASAQQVIEPSKGKMSLEVNKGKLLKLSQGATEVFVADPTIADVQVKSPSIIYVYGRKPGETVLYAVSSVGDVVVNQSINVSHNLSRLNEAFKDLLPGTTVKAQSLDGGIVLTGQVFNATESATAIRLAQQFSLSENGIINQVAVASANQVNLRVRIAEVSRELVKELGVNWDSAINTGNFVFGAATGSPVVGAAGAFLTRNNSTNSLFGSFSSGSADLNALIDALDDENLITVLAEPNLTALSGETAEFLAGGEFPVPVAQENNTISIDFKDFGVSLAFTPTIVGNNRINLKVRPEVSQLSETGSIQIDELQIPALSTRRAETTVELGSGQSFAIAGLIQQDGGDIVKRVPGLSSLPILGGLFRSNRFQRQETELMIVVTPYIVKPVSGQIAMPTDAYQGAPSISEKKKEEVDLAKNLGFSVE